MSEDQKEVNPNNAKLDKEKSNRRKPSISPLPWWVELLFVQIGLPDKYLSKILKIKRQSLNLISNNKRDVLFITLFILSMIYISPVVSNSRLYINCVKSTSKTLSTKLNQRIDNEIRNSSVQICNGSQ